MASIYLIIHFLFPLLLHFHWLENSFRMWFKGASQGTGVPEDFFTIAHSCASKTLTLYILIITQLFL